MLQFLLLLPLVASAQKLQLPIGHIFQNGDMVKGIIEDYMNETAECIRTNLDAGIPEVSLPSFNPLILDNLTLDFDSLQSDLIRGYITIDGETDHIVDYLMTSIWGELQLIPPTYTVNFTLHYDTVSAKGSYGMNLTVLGTNIWGKGDISVGIDNMDIFTHLKAVINGVNVTLQDFQAPITMENFHFNITGLFGDDEYSKQLSQLLEENIPKLINENPDIFIEILGPIILDIFNALMNDEIGVGIIKELVNRCILDVIFPTTTTATF